MGANSAIEWTDHTFNPWWGCQHASPGCEHCYAETFSARVGYGAARRAQCAPRGAPRRARSAKVGRVMGCDPIDLGGGVTGLVCSRGRGTRKRCAVCDKAGAGFLCDFPVGAGKTCDRALCGGCRRVQGVTTTIRGEHLFGYAHVRTAEHESRDFCPEHDDVSKGGGTSPATLDAVAAHVRHEAPTRDARELAALERRIAEIRKENDLARRGDR